MIDQNFSFNHWLNLLTIFQNNNNNKRIDITNKIWIYWPKTTWAEALCIGLPKGPSREQMKNVGPVLFVYKYLSVSLQFLRFESLKEKQSSSGSTYSISMATMELDTTLPAATLEETCSAKLAAKQGEGLRHYYLQHIQDLQLQLRLKTHNLNRLEAQRNELNSRGNSDYSTVTLLSKSSVWNCNRWQFYKFLTESCLDRV